MTLFRSSRATGESLFTDRPRSVSGRTISAREANAQSVVWAARRLRADLISLMPVDVFNPVGDIAVKVTPPPLLVTPSQIADGHPMTFAEWLASGQMDLDGHGNTFGIIKATDALGKPARIDLVAAENVTALIRDGQILNYRIHGELTAPRHVWHERQFTVPGLPIGLSPVAHAALALAGAQFAQEFAVDWFANGATPSAHLKNTEKELPQGIADKIRTRFKASVQTGEVFVTGKDWEYSPIAAKASESGFIDQMKYSDLALARFYGVPADLVDVQVQTSSVSYANITQRNLQFLVMNLGGAIKRREDALTAVMPGKRYVKLNRDAVLAMDAKTRAELFEIQVRTRTRTPDEAREKDDLMPLSESDYAQFERLFPLRNQSEPTHGGK